MDFNISNKQSLLEVIKAEAMPNGNISIRGVARLANVDDMSIIRSADFGSRKIAEVLTWQGFEAADLVKNGFPPQAVILTLEYFAFDSKVQSQQARNLLKTFGTIGLMEVLKQVNEFNNEPEPLQVVNLKSPLELLQEAVQIAIAHEQRIKALEQHNDKMRQEIEEVKEAQEVQELEIVANSAELERFKNGHGDWYTVVGYATKHNKGSYSCRQANLLGRKASALCRLNNITPEKINDPRFGKVNAYPEWILTEVM